MTNKGAYPAFGGSVINNQGCQRVLPFKTTVSIGSSKEGAAIIQSQHSVI